MPRLGELLVQAGAISTEQLAFALKLQQQKGGRLGSTLVELGFLSDLALARSLGSQLGLSAAPAAMLDAIPIETIRLLPADSAAHYRAIPVRLEGNQLWVALSDPTDASALREIAAQTRLSVRPMIAADLLIDYALEKHYGLNHRHRPQDVRVSPHLDLPIETGHTPSAPPTAFVDPYSPIERARIDARVMDLDAIPQAMAPPRLGIATVSTRFVAAGSQREVFDAIVVFLAQDFQRITVLVLRGGRLHGFRGYSGGHDLESLPDVSAAPGELPVIAKVLADGRPRLGRASDKTFGPLVPLVGKPEGGAVLLMPVRCAGQTVGCVIALGGREGVDTWAEEYVRIADKADLSLQSVALRRRIMEER